MRFHGRHFTLMLAVAAASEKLQLAEMLLQSCWPFAARRWKLATAGEVLVDRVPSDAPATEMVDAALYRATRAMLSPALLRCGDVRPEPQDSVPGLFCWIEVTSVRIYDSAEVEIRVQVTERQKLL
ncbi:hypothetical protein QAD02_002309 [Eretmocerus hayati]|uniref:Uncharacterized protein n=1 Tax=Eretmocerus hayati TaxID=131215 RepID=A0ACC2NII8_9HYME|nr:hypothetical protein QAD02_002309 [Eretmocerus hayati]